MIFKIIVLILALFFTSCENKPSRPVTYSIFDVPLDSVESEVWFPELMATGARRMVNLSSGLCLVGIDNKSLVYLVDEKTGKELGCAGMVGQGPEDMQPYPQYVGKSAKGDTLFLFDYNERKLNTYEVTQTKEGLPKLKLVEKKNQISFQAGKTNTSYMLLRRLANGYYVGMSHLSVSDDFLTLLDKDFNVVKTFGEQPLSGLRSGGKVKNYDRFYGSLYVIGNSIYYAAHYFSYMARYDIADMGEVTQVWGKQYAKVDYEVYNEWTISFKNCEENLFGFSDIAVGKKHIFATYSGIPFGEMFKKNSYAVEPQTLVVFNHDGAVLGRFKLSSRSSVICLSENEEYLYIVNTDPEVQIERVRVSDILKKI